MEHTTIAVDLAKSVFQVAVSHRPGHLDEERRLSRDRFLAFFAQRPPATIVLEACGSAHHWARQLQLYTLRGLLREFGVFIPVGAQRVVPRVRELLEDPAAVPMALHPTLAVACDEIPGLEANMRTAERQLATLAAHMPDVQLL
jgi:hypothetical protein